MTSEEREQAVQDWRSSGLSAKVVARKYGISHHTLSRWGRTKKTATLPESAVFYEIRQPERETGGEVSIAIEPRPGTQVTIAGELGGATIEAILRIALKC